MQLPQGFLLQDRYRIEALLGRGGMGAVYRAIDTRLGHAVAIKQNLFEAGGGTVTLANPTRPEDTEARRQQFEREARLLASLKHAGLAKVTDYFFVAGEGQYLVMDFIEGQDFGAVVQQLGALREEQAAGFIIEVAQVLEYLHAQNPPVIHRDIKPANIRVTPAGQVYLVDFGVAKVGTGEKTMFGAQAVTPGYSPLEQFGGDKPTDQRADVYSLAATLYTLVLGSPPPSAIDLLRGKSLVDTSSRVAHFRPGLFEIIQHGMALEPEHRYPTMRAFREALQALYPERAKANIQAETVQLVTQIYTQPMLSPGSEMGVVGPTGRAGTVPPIAPDMGTAPQAPGTAAGQWGARPPTGGAVVGGPTGAYGHTGGYGATGPYGHSVPPPGAYGAPPPYPPGTMPPSGGYPQPPSGGYPPPPPGGYAPPPSGPYGPPTTGAPPVVEKKKGVPGWLVAVLVALVAIVALAVGGDVIRDLLGQKDAPTTTAVTGSGTGGVPPIPEPGRTIPPVAGAGGADSAAADDANLDPEEVAARIKEEVQRQTTEAMEALERQREELERATRSTPGRTGETPRVPPISPPPPAPSPGTVAPSPGSGTATGGTGTSTGGSGTTPATGAPATPPRTATLGDTLVVAGGGASPYRNLAEALDAHYRDGANRARTILMRPGTYPMVPEMILHAPVTIVGQGGPGSVTLVSGGGGETTLRIRNASITLRNVTVRVASRYAVLVVSGRVTMQDCEIVGPGYAGLALTGDGAATLRGVRVSNADFGILATGGSRVDVTGGSLTGNGSGLQARERATVRCSGTEITRNRESGVVVADNGGFDGSGVSITSNGGNGITVRGGTATVNGGRVADNTGFGAVCGGPSAVFRNSGATLTGNKLGETNGCP
jgi:predicted Ser/Thr protein kinase